MSRPSGSVGQQQAPQLENYGAPRTPFDDYDPQRYAGSGGGVAGARNPFGSFSGQGEEKSYAKNPFEDGGQGQQKNVIVHRVKDGDSLTSLSLTYGVAIPLIKKENGITSDDIYYLNEVKIPNPKKTPYPQPEDPIKEAAEKKATLRQAFKNRTGETDEKIIEQYLQNAHYTYYEAVEKYEHEKTFVQKRKNMIFNLKLRFEKDDRDDKMAQYYLESAQWDHTKAYEMYQEDLKGQNSIMAAPYYAAQFSHNPHANNVELTQHSNYQYTQLPSHPVFPKEPQQPYQVNQYTKAAPGNTVSPAQANIDRFTYNVSKKDR